MEFAIFSDLWQIGEEQKHFLTCFIVYSKIILAQFFFFFFFFFFSSFWIWIIISLLVNFVYMSFSWWWSFTRVQVTASFLRALLSVLADQLCCSLDGLYSSPDFLFIYFLFQAPGDISQHAKYKLYPHHLPQLLQLSGKVQVFIFLLLFLLCGLLEQ